MHPNLIIGIGIFFLGSLLGGSKVEHVVLISIDGLRPEFYLDPNWPAPMLQQMVRNGVHAKGVRGVFPSVTYPSHTTMMTGALPARHGIYYNTPFEPDGQSGRWNWEASSIRIPTLWSAVKSAEGTTANIGWPVTVGEEIDFNVPEFWSLDRSVNQIEVLRRVCFPADLLEEIERQATGRLRMENFTQEHLVRDDKAGDAAAYLLETYRPTLLAVHLIEADHFQHDLGRSADLVRRAVAAADRSVSKIYEAAERVRILEKTAFLVVGDHGFVDVHTWIRPNLWLVEGGLLEGSSNRGTWRAAFHTSGGSAFLYLRDQHDREALGRVRQILEAVPAELRALFRVIEKEELKGLGADPGAALALAANPGIVFSSRTSGPVKESVMGGSHGHHPDLAEMKTGFVGIGSGLKVGQGVSEIRLQDIGALVADLLELPLNCPDGSVPTAILEETE